MAVERLTEDRGDRTWKLFHVSWYVNLSLVILALLATVFYLSLVWSEAPNELWNVSMMSTTLVIATVLLAGAGISRYQARLEGQHLELKLTIGRLAAQVEELRKIVVSKEK